MHSVLALPGRCRALPPVSSEEPLFVQLYGAAAVDPAAASFVEPQRRDRYRTLERIAGERKDALPALAVLTGFETYLELRRHNRLPKREVVRVLRETMRAIGLSAAAESVASSRAAPRAATSASTRAPRRPRAGSGGRPWP